MASLIGELLQQVTSKDVKEKITTEEWVFFSNWREKAVKNCFIGASIASVLTFAATRRLNLINRFGLAGGAGFATGYWTLNESSKKCVDQILGFDGGRMQQELKTIIFLRYATDPRKMRTFSKYFYGEEVYLDSSPEHPRLLYRQRHEFIDNPKVYGVSDADESPQNHHLKSSDSSSLKPKGRNMEIKQVRINPGLSMYGYDDPLDALFGYASTSEEGEQSDASGDAAQKPGRTQRRVRRRQRMRNRHRDSLSHGEAQLLRG